MALGRSLVEQLGVLTSASLIYLLGGVLGAAIPIATGRLGRVIQSSDPRYLYGCGGLFVLYMGSLYTALGSAEGRGQALEVGLINYLWPMLTLLLSIPILRLRATVWVVPGALLAVAGVWFATAQQRFSAAGAFAGQSFVPYVLALVAAISWGLYSTLSRRWAGAGGGAVPLFMLTTGIILGAARLISSEQTLWTGRALSELLFMAIATNLAYAAWEQAMRRGDIILVAACSYFTPLLSLVVSGLYFGIGIGANLWIGCGFVIAGAVICRWAVRDPGVTTGLESKAPG